MQFILVHGTFSSPKTWKYFAGELSKSSNDIVISHFSWSGANAQQGRAEASRRLAETIKDSKAKFPDRPLFVVGHSHGGNICRLAGRYMSDDTLQGIICIATPHLHFTTRQSAVKRLINMIYSILWMLLAILLVPLTILLWNSDYVISQIAVRIWSYILISTALAFQLYLLWRMFRLVRHYFRDALFRRHKIFRRSIAWILRQRKRAILRNLVPGQSRTAIVDIRTGGDEAYSYLRFLQFVLNVYEPLYVLLFFLISAMAIIQTITFILTAIVSIGMAATTLWEQFYGRALNPPSRWDLDVAPEPIFFLVIAIYAFGGPFGFLLLLWFLFGGPWNYGVRSIMDLVFLRVTVSATSGGGSTHQTPGAGERIEINISFWQRILLAGIGHTKILGDPRTAAACLTWAKARI